VICRLGVVAPRDGGSLSAPVARSCWAVIGPVCVGRLAAAPDADGLRRLVERVGPQGRVRAVIESMTGARFVRDTPRRPRLAGVRGRRPEGQGLALLTCKTDRIDAQVLAVLSHRELVPAIWLPDPRVRAEREQARFRLRLTCKSPRLAGFSSLTGGGPPPGTLSGNSSDPLGSFADGREVHRLRPRPGFLMPPSVRDWVPEGHLVWTVLDAVAALDLSAIYADYSDDGRGRPAYEPSMMSGLALRVRARKPVLAGDRASVHRGCRLPLRDRQFGSRSLDDRRVPLPAREAAG
jgi:hypothetical protein